MGQTTRLMVGVAGGILLAALVLMLVLQGVTAIGAQSEANARADCERSGGLYLARPAYNDHYCWYPTAATATPTR